RASTALLACAVCATSAAQEAASASDALAATRLLLDTRLRFEGVDQDGLPNDAEALTWRARLGFETGKLWNTSLLAEGDFIWPLTTDYNSTTNGRTAYPVVADPETYEVNRLQLTNTSIPMTVVTVGRQRITLDDHRFVGDVGWRQNDQTFDSLRVVNTSLPNTTFDVSYVSQVNRVFGKDSLQGRYEGDSVLANVSYRFPAGKLTGFGYWLDFEPIAGVPAAAQDSSQTFGLRFQGEQPLGAVKIGYAASYATQSEHADNPLTFDLDYYLAEATLSFQAYSIGAGYEVLEGDGRKGFTTPLATLHKFQGWADKFLATPPNGVEDRYVNAGVTFKGVGPIEVLSALASYHVYEAERTSIDYGSEVNAQLQAKWKRFTGIVKYADYDADDLFTDTTKFWVQLQYVW
ncbi:MAG TPA: hypothetical protein VK025_12775, partial [Steroidobacter sp.]|nr:hypothetical protein [Steroidobacter sp.]